MPVAVERGGAEATLLQLLEHAPRSAQWHVVFLEDGPMTAAVEAFGAQATVVPAGRVRELGQGLRAARRIGAVLRSWRADAVLSWMSKAHLYAAPAAAGLNLPSVWFQHGMPSRTDPIDRLVALLPTGAVLTPSRTVAAAQSELSPNRPVRVAYPGVAAPEEVDPEDRDGKSPLRGLPIARGAPVVGLVARLQRWKGVHVLLEALPAVLRQHPETHAVIVGGDHPLEPGYRSYLEGVVERLGLRGRVHFAGYQANPGSWMVACDVVVHASDREPFGLVVLEAMALGKPLVAGAEGGPAEIIRDGVEGFLVSYGDSSRLAARVSDYIANPELGRITGAAAAARAREFSPARFAGEVVATLDLVREGRRVR